MNYIHKGSDIPQFVSGKWYWNEHEDRAAFLPYTDLEYVNEEFVTTNDFKFRRSLNQIEETLYRQEFTRTASVTDLNVILIKDIRNLVIFLSPSSFLTSDFLIFLHTKEVNMFWHALIIYFEYFLKLAEFILIRRDEIQDKIQSTHSNQVKRIFSEHLSQYRLLLAREYSRIIAGEGNMERFYHLIPIVNISKTIYDKRLNEQFLAFSTQLVWIAMHRRSYDYIEMEMSRLFRSDHFRLQRVLKVQLTKAEKHLLYGRNHKLVNYRAQTSPLIMELMNAAEENLPILWIGERKYRGTDERIASIELEYIIPDVELSLIDVSHGILGHPKELYNTILQINWSSVRYKNYTLNDDPYHLLRQANFKLPQLNAEDIRKHAKTFEHYFIIQIKHSSLGPNMLQKMLRRDEMLSKATKESGILMSVWKRATLELEDKEPENIINVISRYWICKEGMRKTQEPDNRIGKIHERTHSILSKIF